MKEWKKVHIIVDAHTKRVYGVKVTDSKVADTSVLKDLVEPLREFVKRLFADGAYDTEANYWTTSARAGITAWLSLIWYTLLA